MEATKQLPRHLTVRKDCLWSLSASTREAFNYVDGWAIRRSESLGAYIWFVVKKENLHNFTPIIHNRFLRIFRAYYAQPIMLEYDTVENIAKRSHAND